MGLLQANTSPWSQLPSTLQRLLQICKMQLLLSLSFSRACLIFVIFFACFHFREGDTRHFPYPPFTHLMPKLCAVSFTALWILFNHTCQWLKRLMSRYSSETLIRDKKIFCSVCGKCGDKGSTASLSEDRKITTPMSGSVA